MVSIKRTFRKRTTRKPKRRGIIRKYVKSMAKKSHFVPRGPATPFPLVMNRKLTYSGAIAMTQGTPALPAFYLFRANSCFDPDQTGGGTQPRYFDQLCGPNAGGAIYRNYRVMFSSIKCNIFTTSSTAVDQNACFAICPLNASSSVASSVGEMRERPMSKFTYLTTLGSYKPYRCSNAVGIAKFLGNKDLKDNEDASAVYNQNPIDSVSWALTLCSINSLGLATANVLVQITYHVQFFNLNDVADS